MQYATQAICPNYTHSLVVPQTRKLSRNTERHTADLVRISLPSLCLAFLAVSRCSPVCAQQDPLATPPRQWAMDAAANEIKVLEYHAPYLRYRMHVVDSKGDQIRDVIESKDGAVARVILKDGRPLTPEEDAAERERLQGMLDSPSAYAKHIKGETTGKKTAVEIIHQVPDAMLFSYVSGQPQRPGAAAHEVVIDFEPNPAYHSPSMAGEALAGLKGRAWIDPRTHFLTRMEGHVFQAVSLGLVLAKIYPGGELLFEQTQVVPDRWLFTHFAEHLTIRAMMVKVMKENSELSGTQHTEIPTMNYQDAIHLLLSTPLPK